MPQVKNGHIKPGADYGESSGPDPNVSDPVGYDPKTTKT